MRLIDADELLTAFPVDDEPTLTKSCVRMTIQHMPTIEPERIRGKWIDAVIPNDNGGLPVQVCDQCNTFFPLAYTGGGHRFCPHCGADMRGEELDETD